MLEKIKSYFGPVTLKTVQSQFNGPLDLVMLEGKILLDSKHTNYSYGLLERVLEFGIKRSNLQSAKQALILGLGAGSVLRPLTKQLGKELKIDAVEIDPVLIQLAKDEYGILESSALTIHQKDASKLDFLNNAMFDFVLIDLFIDTKIPEFVFEKSFWVELCNHLSPHATLVFNGGLLMEDKQRSRELAIQLDKEFDIQLYDKVEGFNLVLCMKKKNA